MLPTDAPRTASNLKRKHGALADGPELGRPFSIAVSYTESLWGRAKHHVQIDASSPLQRLTLTPRRFVPRYLLPLAYLDLPGPREPQHSQIFTANVQALKPLIADEFFLRDPHILLAESQASGTLYAIEGVQNGVYALCRLAEWVSLDEFGRSKVKSCRILAPCKPPKNEPWWSRAIVTASADGQVKLDKPKLSGLRSILQPPSTAVTSQTKLAGQKPGCTQDVDPSSEAGGPIQDSEVAERQEEFAKDPLSLIRDQYFEALYVSRMSLAFFVKGPLSRARAACTSSETDGPSISELIEVLGATTYKVSQFDQKYNDSLPKLVEELPPHLLQEDEAAATKPFASRIRKSKKRKRISKEGFAPGEEEYAIRWWIRQESATDFDDPYSSKQTRARNAISEQKARETQLQILLILESFALETLNKRSEDGPDPERPLEHHPAKQQKPHDKKSKDANKLRTLLDLLVDKLCIWDSMSQNDFGLGESDLGITSGQGRQVRKSSTQRLRDFCTEVIIPL